MRTAVNTISTERLLMVWNVIRIANQGCN